jgi:hypothetical protein
MFLPASKQLIVQLQEATIDDPGAWQPTSALISHQKIFLQIVPVDCQAPMLRHQPFASSLESVKIAKNCI